MKRKRKDVAADMRNTLREDLGRLLGEHPQLAPVFSVVQKFLAPTAELDSGRARLTPEERTATSKRDIARAARSAFGGVVRRVDQEVNPAAPAAAPKRKRRLRSLGPVEE